MASQDFINKCKQPAYKDRYARFTLNDLDVRSDNYIESIEIEESVMNGKSIIGGCNSKTMKIGLLNLPKDEPLDGINFNLSIGIEQSDYNENINYDSFAITTINDGQTENATDVVCYDLLYKASQKYVCNIDYDDGNTHTVADLWADVCTQLGLEPYAYTFTNSNIPISKNPFTNNETIREVLQEICRVSCSFIVIERDTNRIKLGWLSTNSDPDYIFNDGDYTELSGSLTKTGPINCLILGNSQTTGENVSTQDDVSIEANGEHQLYIDAKYILYNQELRLMALQGIWNKINGLEYVDLKLITPLGKPFLKLGDKIRVITNEGDTYDTYLLKHTFNFNGAFNSTIESPSMTSQEEKMKNDSKSITERVRNTELIVNKQGGTIEEIIEDIDDPDTGIQVRLNKSIRDIESLKNIFQITGGNNCIRNSAFLLKDNVWDFIEQSNSYHTPLGESYNSSMTGSTKSISEIKLQNVKIKTTIDNINNLTVNTEYTLNFAYKQDRNTITTIKLYDTYNDEIVAINKVVCETTSNPQGFTTVKYKFTPLSPDYTLEIETTTSSQDTGYFYLYDLMLNSGDIQTWEPAADEVYSTTLTMSRLGLTVWSQNAGTLTFLTSDGLLIYKTSDGKTTQGLVHKNTAKGSIDESIITEKTKIVSDINDTKNGWIKTTLVINGVSHLVEYYAKENE